MVYDHLIVSGFLEGYDLCIHHGEEIYLCLLIKVKTWLIMKIHMMILMPYSMTHLELG